MDTQGELEASQLRLRREKLTWAERKRLQDHCARLEMIIEARRSRDLPIEHRELKRKRKRKVPLKAKPIRTWRDRRQVDESWRAHLSLDERIAGLRGMLMRAQSPARKRAIEARLIGLEARRGFVDLTLD